jgi:hypothetical protein
MKPTRDCFIDQWWTVRRRGRITLIGILVLIGVVGVIVIFFLLSSIPRIKKTPYRGKTIEFGWSKDLVSDEPAIRAEAVAILCEAMQDKDRAVR